MPRLTAERLRETATAIFRAVGARDDDAVLVADSLVDAELCGHESHGLIRVSEYLRHIREGAIVPDARPELVAEKGANIVVDGNWAFGQVVAHHATEWLIERTVQRGTGAAAIRRSAHVGRVGVYPELAASRGLVALAFVNGGGTKARLAPYCGAHALFGTNPLAAAVPMGHRAPVVIDFSTAAVASGKIRVLRDRGEPLPEGWILDSEGRPSTSPEDYYAGGMLLPAAAHKGYGLCLLVELLAGLLTGSGSLAVEQSDYQLGNGMFMLAIDVSAFMPPAEFASLAGALADAVHATPPAKGCTEVLLPGEPERRIATRRAEEGLEIADSTWQGIAAAAKELGVEI
jgi:LDH2 family malate/lactate/ureidoglycolate dehydrogenase